IYRERLDQIVGVVHAFDVLKATRGSMTAAELMRSPIFVPESTKAMELFTRMERARQGMAVVVDEYGGAVGVVTMEDILEEVVGEIEDEHDEAPQLYSREKDGSFRVKARMSIAQLNRDVTKELGGELPESDDYESLAGLILDRLRHIPKPGEALRLGGLIIEIVVASERRIEECIVRAQKKR
ncbi:MAG TPA: transporter associated domain-containing protein, partial [Pseudomonadota bacterium]|nr:transporter associated domain-containing protein [Pseudomonadota bacterium]